MHETANQAHPFLSAARRLNLKEKLIDPQIMGVTGNYLGR